MQALSVDFTYRTSLDVRHWYPRTLIYVTGFDDFEAVASPSSDSIVARIAKLFSPLLLVCATNQKTLLYISIKILDYSALQ